MSFERTKLEDLSQRQLLDACMGSSKLSDVLANLGYSDNGQLYHKLRARAAEQGVDLPGRRFGTSQSDKPVFGPGGTEQLTGAEAILPSRGKPLGPPIPVKVEFLGYDDVIDRLKDDRTLPYGFQATIDELESEIENFQAEIDKRRAIQEGLMALDE